MKLTLQRNPSEHGATLGKLLIDGVFECFTLEDQVREISGRPVAEWKIPGQTAIPSGLYRVTVDFSMHFQQLMPHILNVPGFDGVRIHFGNTAVDTDGCILVGMKIADSEQPAILESRIAYKPLFNKLWAAARISEPIFLTIENIPRAPESTQET